MARGFAYAYKRGQRPADKPAGNYKTLTPEQHAIGRDRRIHSVNPIPPHVPLVAAPSEESIPEIVEPPTE
jgi:hypothetical protein